MSTSLARQMICHSDTIYIPYHQNLHFLRKCKNYNLGAELSAPHIGTIHNSVDIDTF
jgi:hypothetical protein